MPEAGWPARLARAPQTKESDRMEKVLNQEEIDAMVRKARSGGKGELRMQPEPHVEIWDARHAGQIGREQLRAINVLHEGFARALTHALGAYLRVAFQTTLVSAENLTYREFSHNIPEVTYLASFKLEPMGLNAVLQLDLQVAFSIVDLLLGGEGKGTIATREITEIEEQVVESVARIICRELGVAWQALALEASLKERLEPAEAQRLMSPDEKTLCLSFEITMPNVRGGLNFAVPAAVSNALLRKTSADWSSHRPRSHAESRKRLQRRLLDCPFTVELGANDVRAPIGELAELLPGQLLAFGRSATAPVALLVAGVEMFAALPAKHGHVRAAQIVERRVREQSAEGGDEKND